MTALSRTRHDPRGRMVLQDHRNPVSFRNIRVRKLDPALRLSHAFLMGNSI